MKLLDENFSTPSPRPVTHAFMKLNIFSMVGERIIKISIKESFERASVFFPDQGEMPKVTCNVNGFAPGEEGREFMSSALLNVPLL